ncbi:TPA: restriction endonuclease subunit S [Streptococcus suis]|nr:restriction endonuclease subunit S [Streptococcus suis]
MTRMKDSGIEWIGEVPEEWGIKPIKHIFGAIGSGTTPDSSKVEYYDGNINWLQSGDLYKKDYVYAVSKTITDLGYRSSASLRIYQAPFLAIAMYGASIGNLAISKIDACVNQAVAVLKGEENIVRFTKLALEISKTELIFAAQGGTQPNINQVLIKNWVIPFPSEIEIKKIADFLDKKVAQLDKVKSLLEEQIKTLEDYRQSLIYETVTKGLDKTVPLKDSGVDWIGQIPEGWEVKNFKYVATIKDGTHDTPEYFVEGVPLITSKNLDSVQNRIDFDSAKNISYDDHIKISQRSDVKKGDILMPMIGTVGGATQVLVEKEFSIKNVALFKVAHDEALSRFLYYQLNSRWTNSQLSFMMSGGVQSFVSLNMLSQVKLIIPTSEEIKKINLFLDSGVGKINQMIAIKKEQIENINKQRQTLIYDYVTGKRRI